MRRILIDGIVAKLGNKRTVAIADCVHYCAYRYGRDEINPYEQYAKGLASGLPLVEVRARFVEYIRSFRPRNLGEAIGAQLSRPYPLWYLPWRTPRQVSRRPGWVTSAESVIDVMTYFYEKGIPRSAIEKEFAWHENAFEAIQSRGYRPRQHAYLLALELRGDRSTYLMADGNHRLSALSALGSKSVEIKLPPGTAVVRAKVDRWPLVKAGIMAKEDALAVFDAYFHGNLSPATEDRPADVID